MAEGFFNVGDMNDPRVNAALRQRIAMGLLAAKKGYPKNIGEGLTAIGDALGDIGTMRKMAQFDLGQQDQANAAATPASPEPPSGSPVQSPRAATYAQNEPNEPADTQPAMASRGASPLVTAPAQPASMLHSSLPATMTAPAATSRDLAPPAVARTVAGLGDGSGPATPNSPGPAVPAPGPQAAAQGVGGPAVSPRDAVAAAMLPKPPVMAADDAAPPQTTFKAQNMLPMPPQGGAISAAPPLGAPVKAQSIPAPPRPDPGYVTPNPGAVPQVQQEPMSPREFQLRQLIAANPGNPYFATRLGPELKQLEDARALRQTQNMEQFKSNLITQREAIQQRAKDLGTQTERINKNDESLLTQNKMRYEIGKMADEADVRRQFQNMPPEVAHKMLNESKAIAGSARQALVAAKNIQEAVNGGAIFGAGADFKLSFAKTLTALGGTDKGNLIANTEAFQAQVQPLVAAILKSTVGTNQISENDRRFAQNAAGGNINLDERSVRRIIDFIGQNSRYAVEQHSKLVNGAYPPGSFGQTAYGVDISDIPKSSTSLLAPDIKAQQDMAAKWAADHPDDPRAAQAWKALGYKSAPGPVRY